MGVRLQRERLRQTRNMFSLEEQELTHLGMKLGKDVGGVNTLQDDLFFQVNDDDVFGGEGGLLDQKTVDELHFGGGGGDGGGGDGERKKTKREIMDEIISRSKQSKYERKVETQHQADLIQQVDEQFKEITAMLPMTKGRKRNQPQEMPDGIEQVEDKKEAADKRYEMDEYDLLVKELRASARDVKASDKLKSKEDEAKLRVERLKILEMMREERMKGVTVGQTDLELTKRKTVTLESLKKALLAGDEDDDDDVEEDAAGDDDKKDGMTRKERRRQQRKESRGDWVLKRRWRRELLDDDANLEEVEEEMHAAVVDVNTGEEFPFVIPVPESYEDFSTLLHGNSVEVCRVVMNRILLSNDPLLDPANSAHLRRLHVFILAYCLRLDGELSEMLSFVAMAVRLIHKLIMTVPSSDKDVMTQDSSVFFPYRVLLNVLSNVEPTIPPGPEERIYRPLLPQLSHVGRRRAGDARSGKKIVYFESGYPSRAVVLVLLHLSTVFSATDRMHAVWTPVLAYLCAVLSSAPHSSYENILTSCMICDALFPILEESRRYAPEVPAFLVSAAQVCRGSAPSLHSHWTVVPSSLPPSVRSTPLSDCVLRSCLSMMRWLQRCPSFASSLRPLLSVLTPLFPSLKPQIASLPPLAPLQLRARAPVALPDLKPSMFLTEDFAYHGGDHDPDRERRENKRLQKKLKQEKRGAMRELKRDREFINNLKMTEFQEETAERNQSLKGIMSFLQGQQKEHKAQQSTKL